MQTKRQDISAAVSMNFLESSASPLGFFGDLAAFLAAELPPRRVYPSLVSSCRPSSSSSSLSVAEYFDRLWCASVVVGSSTESEESWRVSNH
ncbi:hypothetical protein BV898_18154 [Hypsibius exemplaris]|uniref:Uncharacterized protein n=1 Tax=Hypsibius exemplaris TaxID=2072580 RepID=A0A9X6NGV3_HYPEX|nr:hypothetical protein BV898_18154 [Hypsibius exemplaris]